ncbi:MAG: hypothetical protein IJS63_09420 [Bacteroidaceae bacterium]|nr:hypothetical protein [Bacteroidaceae bacterium]
MAKKVIEFRVVIRNRYGHRWIEEPLERVAFRNKCKHQMLGCLCEKGYKCYVADNPRHIVDGVIIGCTPNVSCPRLRWWDSFYGLKKPYTMVENNHKTHAAI